MSNEKRLEHYPFKSDGKERVKGLYHIQNGYNYDSRLKSRMDRFNGVVTKYLDHYLSWFHFLAIIRFRDASTTVSKMVIDSCLLTTNATYNKLRLTKFSY